MLKNVLILEEISGLTKFDKKIVTQSYFHYLPSKNHLPLRLFSNEFKVPVHSSVKAEVRSCKSTNAIWYLSL